MNSMLRRVRSFSSLRRRDSQHANERTEQPEHGNEKQKGRVTRTLSLRSRSDRSDRSSVGAKIGRTLSLSRRQDTHEPLQRDISHPNHENSVPAPVQYDSSNSSMNSRYTESLPDSVHNDPDQPYSDPFGAALPWYTTYTRRPFQQQPYTEPLPWISQFPSTSTQTSEASLYQPQLELRPPLRYWTQPPALGQPLQLNPPAAAPLPLVQSSPSPQARHVLRRTRPIPGSLRQVSGNTNALVNALERDVDALCQRLEAPRAPPRQATPTRQAPIRTRASLVTPTGTRERATTASGIHDDTDDDHFTSSFISYSDATPPFRRVNAERHLMMQDTSTMYDPMLLQGQRASIASGEWEHSC